MNDGGDGDRWNVIPFVPRDKFDRVKAGQGAQNMRGHGAKAHS